MLSTVFRGTNHVVSQLRQLILELSKEYIDEYYWNQLCESATTLRGNYIISDDDIPNIRDLKALLNMLTDLEVFTETSPFRVLNFFKYVTSRELSKDFQRNYQIFMTTEGVLAPYIKSLKEGSMQIMVFIFAKIKFISTRCTLEHLDKAVDFFIDNVHLLDKMKEEYQLLEDGVEKKVEQKVETPKEEKKGLFYRFSEVTDHLLALLEGEIPVNKDSLSVPWAILSNDVLMSKKKQDYHEEDSESSLTKKNLYRLSNGFLAIDNLSRNSQGVNSMWSVLSISYCAVNLKTIYDYLRGVNCKAILADRAGMIRVLLKKLDGILEEIACFADTCENETFLKKHKLLWYVDLLIERYNLILRRLNISIDNGARQENTYMSARLRAREDYLKKLNSNVKRLVSFLNYQDNSIAYIPRDIREDMLVFFEEFKGKICVDPECIKTYKEGINPYRLLVNKMNLRDYSNTQAAHPEVMLALRKMKLYMQRQINFIVSRNDEDKEYMHNMKEMVYREYRR